MFQSRIKPYGLSKLDVGMYSETLFIFNCTYIFLY